MRQFKTQAIVLARTNYGEADRIITFLTPDSGKVKAIAKAVRKQKSKLAGGIELFSVSDISFVTGRGEISTLTGSRLARYYGQIVKDLDRTNLGYELIKRLNKATEDQPEEAYFKLMEQALAALDDANVNLGLIDVWFSAQLLRLAGHSPNLRTVQGGQKLSVDETYDFNLETMAFQPGDEFDTNQIKFLRLLFSSNPPAVLQKVQNCEQFSLKLQPLVRSLSGSFISN